MINNRGQAFSVFELLIAAIVAVAILFVLLPFLPDGDGIKPNAKDAIGNNLSTYKNGGSGQSDIFSLNKGGIISSFDFVEKGFDSSSIILTIDDKLSPTLFDVSVGEKSTQITYKGSTEFNARATITCAVNGLTLLSILETAGTKYYPTDAVPSICQNEEYTPCCLVILKRG